jgi:thiol:disulfide interchange protein DsbA
MKRRAFFASAASLAAGTSALLPSVLLAQGATPQAGTDYVKLGRIAPVEAAVGKIEVVEFFWYSCGHCNAFEPTLSRWSQRLPKDVVFKRVPIAFQDSYVPQQQLYYALDAMGLVETFHAKVFAAIHTERQNLVKPEAILQWVAKQGIDQTKFLAHFNSFSTSTKASRARQLMSAYEVEGVPAMGVAGRFYTDGSMAKSMERALAVTDFLLAEVRLGR